MSLSPSPKKIFFDRELSIAMHQVTVHKKNAGSEITQSAQFPILKKYAQISTFTETEQSYFQIMII
jgi:hypothetical protein